MNKRLIFLITGLTDALLGGVLLLTYFGLIPLDLADWLQAPRWMVGAFGALLFFSGLGVLAFQLTRTDNPE
jgi:hypothetical protein